MALGLGGSAWGGGGTGGFGGKGGFAGPPSAQGPLGKLGGVAGGLAGDAVGFGGGPVGSPDSWGQFGAANGGNPQPINFGNHQIAKPFQSSTPYSKPLQTIQDTGGGVGTIGGVIAGQSAGATPQSNATLDMLMAQYGPGISSAMGGMANTLGQLPFVEAGYQSGADHLRAMFGFDMQDLQNRMAGIGLDRQGLDIDRAGLGVDRESNVYDRGHIDRLRDIATRSLDSSVKRMGFEGAETMRNTLNDYTARGSLFAPGYGQNQGATFARTLNDVEQARLAHENTMAGFDKAYQGTLFSDKKIGLSEDKLNLANQRLDQMASSMGVDRARMEYNLQHGLQQLGLEGAFSIQEILAGASSDQGNVASAMRELLAMIVAYGVPMGDQYSAAFPGSPTVDRPIGGAY